MSDSGSRKPRKAKPLAKPSAGDAPAIAAFLRVTGSIAFYKGDVPDDFVSWRQAIRRATKALDMRVSVRRHGNTVWVLDPDYEPTDDVMRATIEAIASIGEDQPIDFPTALERQRRSRLSVVRDDNLP